MRTEQVLTLGRYHYYLELVIAALLLSGCWAYVNKEAMQKFQNRQQDFRVTIYPVNVIRGNETRHDVELAAQLQKFLQMQNLADPVLGKNTHEYEFLWGHNQAAMAKRSAQAFASQVAKDNIDTDYALLVEILCNQGETNVFGVEYYLVDKLGHPADGSLSNSDWQDFKAVNPKNRKGGILVAEKMLKHEWQSKALSTGGF